MKKSPTQLMKQEKYIQDQIIHIINDDVMNSKVLVEKKEVNGSFTLLPLYDNPYNFQANREKLNKLYEQERKIKKVLNAFNVNTNIKGYDFTISEGLVKISQLRQEIKCLKELADRKFISKVSNYNDDSLTRLCYSLEEVNDILNKKNSELSSLLVAIDLTNLTSCIEVDLD